MLAVDVLLPEVGLAAEVAFGDRVRLVDPAAPHEVAGRLGQPDPGHERDHGGDDAGGEHPAPRQPEAVGEQVGQHHGDQVADVPGDEHPGQAPPASGGRRELRQQRGAERVLRADRDAEQEPHDHELPRRGDHRLEQAQHHEHRDVDPEQGLAAEPVGQGADHGGAEEDADQGGRGDEPALPRVHPQLGRDQREDHGDDAEIEAVEALPDRRRRGHPPQHAHVPIGHERER